MRGEDVQYAVVNLGCGLDDTFRKCDNGKCKGYNIDMPDVITVRNELLPESDRERNIACNLNDEDWMNTIDAREGEVFFASGVFYYFRTEDMKVLLHKMAKSYMLGYRDIYKDVSLFHKLMIRFCDSFVKMQIIKTTFR